MKTENPKQNTPVKRTWKRRLFVILIVIVCIPLGLISVGWFNRDTLIDVLQDWYSDHHNGTLSIGSVDYDLLSGFPRLGFTISDIEHSGMDSISDRETRIFIEKAKVIVRTRDLLKGDIKLSKISIIDATIHSEVIPRKPLDYYVNLKQNQNSQAPDSLKISELLNKGGVKFSLQNVSFISKDTLLNKNFNVLVNLLEGEYKKDGSKITGESFMDANVNALGFNSKKGAFFNGARVKGKPHFEFDIDKQLIHISQFAMDIDEQRFDLSADFDLFGKDNYHFTLENDSTDYQSTKYLLTKSISTKLDAYSIVRPFESSLDLVGNFGYGNSPTINAEFKSSGNQVLIADDFQLDGVRFQGYLTTDVYASDSANVRQKSPKDIKVYMERFEGNIEGIEVVAQESYFQSTPDALNFLNTSVTMVGTNDALASLIDTDNFDFEGGNFKLEAKIEGDISSPDELITMVVGNFNLQDSRISLKKNGLQLPIANINLDLQNELATLNELKILLPNEKELVLTGRLSQPGGLLSKVVESNTTSVINIASNNLEIDDILDMATEMLPRQRASNSDRKNLHETLDAIYRQFHPKFNIDLKSMNYEGVELNDLKGSIELQNSETIFVDGLTFNYSGAATTVEGHIRVPQPNGERRDPINVNIDALSQGTIKVFKDLFNIKRLDLVSGDFRFEGNVTGSVYRFRELLQNATGDLNLTNNLYYYPPADINVQIDSLHLNVENSNIRLDQFAVDLGELHPIELNGSVRQFPSFLLDDDLRPGSIDLNVNIPYLDGNRLMGMIPAKDSTSVRPISDRKDVYSVFSDINHFDPRLQLTIDSLKYRDLLTENVKASVQFENDSILTLRQFQIDYKSSKAAIIGNIIAHDNGKQRTDESPFEFTFDIIANGQSEDLNDYLKTTNFIFRSGNFDFRGRYKGESDNLTLVQSNATGRLKLGPSVVYNEAAELRIPIDSLDVEIENNVASLKALDINLPGKSSVDFSGTINDFSSFIDNDKKGNRKGSDFKIYAPYLDTNDLKRFFGSSDPEEKIQDSSQTALNLSGLKDALVGINTSFNPRLNIVFDTLLHEKITLREFSTKLFYNQQGDFEIDGAELDFYGGKAKLNIEFGLSESKKLPIKIDLNAENINLFELVSRLDYLKDDALRAAEKIDGTMAMKLDANGWLDDEGHLDTNSLNGTLQIDLRDLALFGYQPVMENVPLMKDQRFEHLRFRPIVQTFKVVDGKIMIPRTEIQSSALQCFVEGSLRIDDYVNIWISLPWKNLQKNDGLRLPEKTGYAQSGGKFYLQLVKDTQSPQPRKQALKVKFRLSGRKLKQQRRAWSD